MRNDKTDTDWLALAGQVCVVTGAGSGIGAATAEELARLGAAVAVLDRDGDAAERTAHLIGSNGGTAIAITADVADEASVKAAARAVEAQLGPCRTLVNNAAVGSATVAAYADEKPAQDSAMLAINADGALKMAQGFLARMRPRAILAMVQASGNAISRVSAVTMMDTTAVRTKVCPYSGSSIKVWYCARLAS